MKELTKLKLAAMWRQSRLAWLLFVFELGVAMWAWPYALAEGHAARSSLVLASLAFFAAAALASLHGYRRGPLRTTMLGVSFFWYGKKAWLHRHAARRVMMEFGKRWNAHPDTHVSALDVWDGCRVHVFDEMPYGPAGRHDGRAHTITLKWHPDTLSYELGHALMTAQNVLVLNTQVGDDLHTSFLWWPPGPDREAAWLQWRLDRGLM